MLRSLPVAAALVAVSAAIACGSSSADDVFSGGRPAQTTSSPGDSDASAPPAADSDAASSATDSGSALPADASIVDAAPKPQDAAAPSCKTLLEDVERLRGGAVECSFVSPQAQCKQTLDDVCCKLTVTSTSTKAALDFKAAVDAFRNAKCSVSCANVNCGDAPSQQCILMSGARGVCKQ